MKSAVGGEPMSVQSFVVAAMFILVIAFAQPSYAVSVASAGVAPTVSVQWFVQGREIHTPLGGRYYRTARPVRGLWQRPNEGELRQIYLRRLDDRNPDQGVPFVLVQW